MGTAQLIGKIQHAYEKKEPLLIAIEGKCGSGKSTLTAMIQEACPVNVLHMEHFVLPKEQQSDGIGGAIDFERLNELLISINEGKQGKTYAAYNAELEQMQDVAFADTTIFIVEGVYSMHPKLAAQYDWAVFLRVSEEGQILRLHAREPKEKLTKYLAEQMPVENCYFETLHIEEQCEIVLTEQELAV